MTTTSFSPLFPLGPTYLCLAPSSTSKKIINPSDRDPGVLGGLLEVLYLLLLSPHVLSPHFAKVQLLPLPFPEPPSVGLTLVSPQL